MSYNNRYDIVGFANDLCLNMLEISDLYVELINEINLSLIDLKTFMLNNDLIKIQKIIHNIKGVCGNYRITDVYEESSRINDLLKSRNCNNLESDLNNLFEIINLAEKEIENFFIKQSIHFPINKHLLNLEQNI